jgi:O-antigen ligase
MKLKWIFFIVCLVLMLGSLVGGVGAYIQRKNEIRGWENASTTKDLPYRVPLAGVNVDLTQYNSDDELNHELDQIEAAGFTWVRQPFLWEQIEPENNEFTWDTYDRIVAAVDAHEGLQLVAVLDGAPRWARSTLAPDHPFAPPASVMEYGEFAGAVANHYGGSITYYQIWDEPNIRSHWGTLDPRPAHYVAMLRQAYPAIHGHDETAQVIAAALAPTTENGPENISDIQYLRAIYDQGGQDYFDAAAGKPYGFDSGPYDRRVDPGTLNFSRLILLREEMVAHGDSDKPLWGSNFGWNHLPDDWAGPPSIWGQTTAEQQANYTHDAYQRAMREWPWIGGLIVQHWQPDAPADDPIQGFAIAPIIDTWDNVLPVVDALMPGLYPAQNPYTTYEGDWRFSDLGADSNSPADSNGTVENRIIIRFDGSELAMLTRRDDYTAYLYVTIDGEPANALPRNREGDAFILLTSPHRDPSLDLILLGKGLSEGIHTAEIVQRPILGDDRWPIAGFAVGQPPDTRTYDVAMIIAALIGVLSLVGAGFAVWRLPWRSVKLPTVESLRTLIQWFTSLLVSFLVLVGSLLTWGETIPAILRRDPPALAITILTAGIASLSPAFVVTLAAILVLFVLIYNRPLLGILLIIFWSAFFLSTLDFFFHLFATVEVYIVLTFTAVIARGAVEWAKQVRAESPRRPKVKLKPLDWIAIAWALLGIISITWAEYRGPAIHQLRVVMLEPVAFYFLIRLMRFKQRDLIWLADTLLFTGTAIAIVGLVMYIRGGSNVVETQEGSRRLMSIYGSPNGVGLYLGRCLPFAAAYVLLPLTPLRRIFGAVTGVIMLIAVILSQSRGALLLGLPFAAIVILFFRYRRRAFIPVLITAATLVIALIGLAVVLPRISNLMGDTTFFRVHLWYSSLNLIREHPITGVGLDQFLYWYRSRYLLPEAWEEPNLSIPHNVLLNYWVNLGLMGVLLGMTFQGNYWRKLWRMRATADPVRLALILGLAGSMAYSLAHGMVDVFYFSINMSFAFFLFMGMVQRLSDE